MNNEKLTLIKFVVNKKIGVISFLMLNGGELGLMYKKKFERDINENQSEVLVYYSGKSNMSDIATKASFEKHSDVFKVIDISEVNRDDMRAMPRPDVVTV